MSQELIYTSAPQGLRPGSRGFCTVASTAGMPPNLAEKLEALSGYRHIFPSGNSSHLNPTVYSYLRLAVGGRNYYVLSRIADAGHDYTQRTNKIAHHVALDQHELTSAGPAWLMSQSGFMESTWQSDPRILPAGRKPPLGNSEARVCQAWESLVGDAGWAGVLAETAIPGNARHALLIYEPGVNPLPLIAESLALLPAKRRWAVTFSTYYTKLPPGLDCQWRCVIAGSPEAKMAHAVPKALVLNLMRDIGPAEGGILVQAARTGRVPVDAAPMPVLPPTVPDAGTAPTSTAAPPRLAAVDANPIAMAPPTSSRHKLPSLATHSSNSTQRKRNQLLRVSIYALALLLFLLISASLYDYAWNSSRILATMVGASTNRDTIAPPEASVSTPAGARGATLEVANPATSTPSAAMTTTSQDTPDKSDTAAVPGDATKASPTPADPGSSGEDHSHASGQDGESHPVESQQDVPQQTTDSGEAASPDSVTASVDSAHTQSDTPLDGLHPPFTLDLSTLVHTPHSPNESKPTLTGRLPDDISPGKDYDLSLKGQEVATESNPYTAGIFTSSDKRNTWIIRKTTKAPTAATRPKDLLSLALTPTGLQATLLANNETSFIELLSNNCILQLLESDTLSQRTPLTAIRLRSLANHSPIELTTNDSMRPGVLEHGVASRQTLKLDLLTPPPKYLFEPTNVGDGPGARYHVLPPASPDSKFTLSLQILITAEVVEWQWSCICHTDTSNPWPVKSVESLHERVSRLQSDRKSMQADLEKRKETRFSNPSDQKVQDQEAQKLENKLSAIDADLELYNAAIARWTIAVKDLSPLHTSIYFEIDDSRVICSSSLSPPPQQ